MTATATASPTSPPHHIPPDTNETHADDRADVNSLLTIMIALVLVSLFSALPKRVLDVIPVVYVLLLFILCLSSILIACNVDISAVFGALYLSKNNSELLQSIYLPPLIFSEVFKLNIRTFRTAIWQVMWLIFPGVVFGACLTAVYVLFVMPSGPPFFSVYEALCFGGALSTTDPIAVLMVLHEIGAPVRLKALVGGESLLNDGTSIIIVTLFLQLQEGVQYSAGDIVGFVFRELCVGPVFGVFVGVVMLGVMRMLEDQVVPLVTLSFACPFIIFIITSTYFKSSGVLALVCMGLVINRFGRAFLNKHLEHVEAFWNQIEHVATCLLYTQSGLYVAQDFYLGGITATDWGSLFGLFLWITMVRAVMIFASFPLLKRLGYGLTWREAVVMVHGGLRGAVSILLSFTIAASPAVDSRVGSLTLFFVAGVVLLMCVNVVTTGPLCRALGLQFDKKQPVYATLIRILEQSTVQTLDSTGMDNAEEVWHAVSPAEREAERSKQKEEESPPPPPPPEQQQAPPTASARQRLFLAAAATLTSATGLASTPSRQQQQLVIRESIVEKRYHLNLAFKQTFETLLETKLITRPAWFSLLMSVEGLIDEHRRNDEHRLLTWDCIERRLELSKLRVCCLPRGEYLAVEQLLTMDDEDFDDETSNGGRLATATAATATGEGDVFPTTHNATVEHFTYCAFGLLVAHERSRRIMRETFFQDKRDLALLLEESVKACAAPARFINRVFVAFPAVIAKIKRHHAKAQVHRQNLSLVRGMRRRGILSEAVLKQLVDGIEAVDHAVQKMDFTLQPPLNVGRHGEGLDSNPNFGPFRQRAGGPQSLSSVTAQPPAAPLRLKRQSSLISHDGGETMAALHDGELSLADAAFLPPFTRGHEEHEEHEEEEEDHEAGLADRREQASVEEADEFVERLLTEAHFPSMQDTLDRLEGEQQVQAECEPEIKF